MAVAKHEVQAQGSTALADRNIVDSVGKRIAGFIQNGELHLPANYSADNALKAAWLVLQEVRDSQKRPALQVCTRESIANALLDMVAQGLNPAKRQCYFIVYGNQLVCQRSYFGDMAVVKRVLPDADIWFNVVYEGDQFEFTTERGRLRIVRHQQALENMGPDKLVGAYCVIEVGGEPIHTEIMTMEQIRRSWSMSKQYDPKGGKTPHHAYPDQMALRTVIRRACKTVINSSGDDYLLLHHYNRSDEMAFEAEVAAEANGEVIDVTPDGHAEADEPPARSAPEEAMDAAFADAPADDRREPQQVGLKEPGF